MMSVVYILSLLYLNVQGLNIATLWCGGYLSLSKMILIEYKNVVDKIVLYNSYMYGADDREQTRFEERVSDSDEIKPFVMLLDPAYLSLSHHKMQFEE